MLAEDLTFKVYRLVAEHGEGGVLQKVLCKKLSLGSRDGSRIAIRLEKHGKIRREKVLDSGRWTYRLIPLRTPVNMKSIEKFPCAACAYGSRCSISGVVSPLFCPWIAEWVINEFRENVSFLRADFGA